MDISEMKTILEKSGFPVVYGAWPEEEAPALPYICFSVPYTNNFAADGRVFKKVNHWQIELYTPFKDPESERKVEEALASFFFEMTGDEYLEDERCQQVIYEMED